MVCGVFRKILLEYVRGVLFLFFFFFSFFFSQSQDLLYLLQIVAKYIFLTRK
jgi:hypothetical protein